MSEEQPEDLRGELAALRAELGALRREVESLKDGKGLSSAEPLKAQPPEPPAPAGSRLRRHLPSFFNVFDAFFGTKKIPPPATKGSKPGPLSRAPKSADADLRPAPAAAGWTLDEKFVGEKLLQYAGMVLLALGVLFFLIWRAAHTGPMERVIMAAAAGAALIGLGRLARGEPRFADLSQTLVGGGWTVLYLTAYAASHFEPTKVVADPLLGLGVLAGVALGMAGTALASGSRPLRLYAFGLTYFVFFFCREEVTSFDLYLLLHLACVFIAAQTGEADVLWVSLIGYHASYLPSALAFLRDARSHSLAEFVRLFLWQAGSYAAVAALPLVPRARERLMSVKQGALFDGALSLNALAFAGFGGMIGHAYFGTVSLPRAAPLSLSFALPGLLYLRVLPRRSTAAGLCAVLALGALAAAALEMPDPMWKMIAWASISCAGVWLGLFFDAPVWRAASVTMATMTFFFYAQVAAGGGDQRRAASAAMFLFSGLCYLFARFYRVWLEGAEEWEKPAGEAWLYGGTAGLLLALWGVLDAAPFLCALVGLSIAGELLAVRLPRLHLWVQASLLELGLGFYSLLVDYGPGGSAPVFSPRLLVTGVMLAGWSYLYFEDPMDEALSSKWKHWSRAEQRTKLTWVALAAVSFAVYKEFDGFTRLPVWALGAALLFLAGRLGERTHFKQQALALSVVAGAEAILTYLTAPRALAGARTDMQASFYGLSCLALLSMVLVAKERRWGRSTELDRQAAAMLSVVSLTLMAAYCYKEFDAVTLTMYWTALGTVYLLGGMMAGWRELRLPGLCLLGLCVGKALLIDSSQLALPWRVASFIGLGVVLLGGSSLYVRMDHEENASSAGDD